MALNGEVVPPLAWNPIIPTLFCRSGESLSHTIYNNGIKGIEGTCLSAACASISDINIFSPPSSVRP